MALLRETMSPVVLVGWRNGVTFDKAVERVRELSPGEQDSVGTLILNLLDEEQAWQERLNADRGIIRRLAQEALEQDRRGETAPLDGVL